MSGTFVLEGFCPGDLCPAPFVNYSGREFLEKQKELEIRPITISLKFIHNTFILFYRIVNSLINIVLPDYITVVHPEYSRYTRNTALDSYTHSCPITSPCDNFKHNFFYRSMMLWNKLPLIIIIIIITRKTKLQLLLSCG